MGMIVFVTREDAEKLIMDSNRTIGKRGVRQLSFRGEILLMYGSKLKKVKDRYNRTRYAICGSAYDGSDVSKHVTALHDLKSGNVVK